MTVAPSDTGQRVVRTVTNLRRIMTALALGAVVGYGGLTAVGGSEPATTPDPLVSTDDVEADLMERHQCSVTGFDGDTIPSEAILRPDEGPPRVVSFDRGWESFTGDAPGTLVAVCLGPTHPR